MLQNENIKKQKEKAIELISQRVNVPVDYQLVNYLLQSHDEKPVFIFRYEMSDKSNRGLGGEHFSVSVDLDATKIMGIIHMEKQHSGNGLPSDEGAKETAINFLPSIAPDLIGEYEVKWVMRQLENPNKIPHESPFPLIDEKGEEFLLTGVRVKLFFENLGTWGWVIVGRDKKIISFEREVVWNTTMNRRSTAAWLHDSFIKEQISDLESLC